MNAQMSIKVLELIAGGMSGADALRQVCGAEIVDEMLSGLYDALRAKGLARAAQ